SFNKLLIDVLFWFCLNDLSFTFQTNIQLIQVKSAFLLLVTNSTACFRLYHRHNPHVFFTSYSKYLPNCEKIYTMFSNLLITYASASRLVYCGRLIFKKDSKKTNRLYICCHLFVLEFRQIFESLPVQQLQRFQ